MKNTIRIGTRRSPLALWQANQVAEKLSAYKTELVPIVSSGDKNLAQPLYQQGIVGVFTKDLDIALLNHEIDIAVHSLKDVPTELPKGLKIVACLERDFPQDVLVRAESAKNKSIEKLSIATSSLRRRAFWSRHFGKTEFFDIRGNIQTRIKKLNEGLADATIFSLAGLKRMEMNVEYEELPMMLQAPSQGVVAIVAREFEGNEAELEDKELGKVLETINHRQTSICVEIERSFLKHLEGGCTAPIGVLAEMENEIISFSGMVCSLDGQKDFTIKEEFSYEDGIDFGKKLAEKIIQNGAGELMNEFRKRV